MKIYIAEVNYGTCYLAEVEAEEKEKTYRVTNRNPRTILGNGFFYIGKSYKKDSVFLSVADAIKYLKGVLTNQIESLNDALQTAMASLDVLDKFPIAK